jgi:hypothetical protein
MDIDVLNRDAALPGEPHGISGAHRRAVFDSRVRRDNSRAVAAEFQGHPLQSRGGLDLGANAARSRERDEVCPRMPHEGRACDIPIKHI